MANVKEFSVEEKLTALLTLQKIESKLDELHILKGELPMEVADLEDEIQGLHARQLRVEEEINGVTDFINQRKEAIKESEALIKKYEKQSSNVKNNREFEAINKEMEMQQLEVKLAEKHIKDATEEIAEKAVLLDKAKKNIAGKESVLARVSSFSTGAWACNKPVMTEKSRVGKMYFMNVREIISRLKLTAGRHISAYALKMIG